MLAFMESDRNYVAKYRESQVVKIQDENLVEVGVILGVTFDEFYESFIYVIDVGKEIPILIIESYLSLV